MSIHTSLPDETEFAMETLYKKYDDFDSDFNQFFQEIIQAIKEEFGIKLPYPLS